MENEIVKITEKTFEDIKHIDENGNEFWYARELMGALEYIKWGNFKGVIEKAMISCNNSSISALDHFAEVGKTVPMPSGAKPNGDLVDTTTGRNLYALHWEGIDINAKIEKDGFVVKVEGSIEFLEENLEILGLNEREAQEFIVYWLSKLEAN